MLSGFRGRAEAVSGRIEKAAGERKAFEELSFFRRKIAFMRKRGTESLRGKYMEKLQAKGERA